MWLSWLHVCHNFCLCEEPYTCMHSYENVFHVKVPFHVNQTNSHTNGFAHEDLFTEAQGNMEMAF